MRVSLSLLLALIVILSACLNDVLRTNPTHTPTLEQVPTPPGDLVGSVGHTSPAATPTATPTTEMDRSLENGRPLAARVNQQPIFLAPYEQQITRLAETLVEQGVDLNSQAGQARLSQLRQQVFEGLIDQMIIEQEAARLGLSITGSELEEALQTEIERAESLAELQTWLATNNLSDEELRNILRTQLLANRLFEQISAGIPETAVQAQVQYIRVADEPTARVIVEQLKQGTDFGQLARAYSAPGLAWHETEPDWIAKGQGVLPADVEEIAFGLEAGQMNGPIPTPAGYYIVKLLNKEAQRPISQEMAQNFKKQIFSDWLTAQRSAATIERFIDW